MTGVPKRMGVSVEMRALLSVSLIDRVFGELDANHLDFSGKTQP
jgi:hypothetical protein